MHEKFPVLVKAATDNPNLDLVGEPAEVLVRLRQVLDAVFEEYEQIPDLLEPAAEFTGALADYDDELGELDAAVTAGLHVAYSLLRGSFAEFADDEEADCLAFLMRINSESTNSSELDDELEEFRYSLNHFVSYYGYHHEIIEDICTTLRQLNRQQLLEAGIDTELLAEWLQKAELYLTV